MRRAFPICEACQGNGRADRDFDDVPTSCRVCDGARVDIYASDPRMAGSSREAVRLLDIEATEAAWRNASETYPEPDWANLPASWTESGGKSDELARMKLTVAILERNGSPAVMHARVAFRLPLEPETRFPRTPWLRPWMRSSRS